MTEEKFKKANGLQEEIKSVKFRLEKLRGFQIGTEYNEFLTLTNRDKLGFYEDEFRKLMPQLSGIVYNHFDKIIKCLMAEQNELQKQFDKL